MLIERRDTASASEPNDRAIEDLPLAGLRVLDFSRVLAGPLCTQLLGDLGADVIKVESTDIGDETRAWPPFESDGFGTVFLAVNRNKRSIAVNLKDPAGRDVVHRLATKCDVAIENFSTGVAARLGIDYDTLRRLNDKLVYCTISGYGRNGPLANSAGYDVILQAFSGIMSLTGEPNGGHIRIPISPIDHATGLNALTGILAALIRRASTGRGGHIEACLLDSAIGLLNHPLQSYWKRGVQPLKWGSSHESLSPYEVFEAADGPVMIGIANDNLWRKFCNVAGLTDVVADPRFCTNAKRAEHRAELLAIVRPAIGRMTVAEWVSNLSALSIPVSAINSLASMLASPQVAARKIIVDYDLENGQPMKAVGMPFVLDQRDRTVRRPPPARGEHSVEVLEEYGFAPQEIADLRARAIVVADPATKQETPRPTTLSVLQPQT